MQAQTPRQWSPSFRARTRGVSGSDAIGAGSRGRRGAGSQRRARRGWLAGARSGEREDHSNSPRSALGTLAHFSSAAAAAADAGCRRRAPSDTPPTSTPFAPQLAARGYATQIGRSLMFSDHGVPEKVGAALVSIADCLLCCAVCSWHGLPPCLPA